MAVICLPACPLSDTDSIKIPLIQPVSSFGFSSLLLVPKQWQSHLVSGFLVNVCASNQNLFVHWTLGTRPPPTTDWQSVLKWFKMKMKTNIQNEQRSSHRWKQKQYFTSFQPLIHWRQTSASCKVSPLKTYFHMTCWYLVVYEHVVEVQTRQGGLVGTAGPTMSSWSWVRQ